MSFVSLGRVIRFGAQNFTRNVWLAAATVSVLALTLVSINCLVVVNLLGKVAIDLVKSKIDVAVHFKPEIEEERVHTVRVSLLSLPEVKEVEYVSPAQSLERFSQLYKKDELIQKSLGEIGDNPFGSTLIVKAKALDGYPKIIKALDEPIFSTLIEEKDFDDREIMISRVEQVARRVETFGFGASLFFGLITLLIIFNTIRVSIYTHREEIRIMRLVGAADSFIRGPFYVEAILWSTLAMLAAAALIYPLLSLLQPFVQSFFGTTSVDLLGFYRVNYLRIFGSQYLAVVVMALVTTKLATGRYLRA
ncbi:MAG: permease-like cell division protein FtsX [Patescibacteria group bacterium]|jgi:cell division transport system permease protein